MNTEAYGAGKRQMADRKTRGIVRIAQQGVRCSAHALLTRPAARYALSAPWRCSSASSVREWMPSLR
jgi:hypothetical protein